MGLPIFSEEASESHSRSAPKPDNTATARSTIRRQPTVRPHRRNGLLHDTERLERYLASDQRPSEAWNSQLPFGASGATISNRRPQYSGDSTMNERVDDTFRPGHQSEDSSERVGQLMYIERPVRSSGRAMNGRRRIFTGSPLRFPNQLLHPPPPPPPPEFDFDQYLRNDDDDDAAAQATIDRLNARERAAQDEQDPFPEFRPRLPGIYVVTGGEEDNQPANSSLWETDMMSNPISHRQSLRLPTPPRPMSRYGPTAWAPREADLESLPPLRRMGHRRIQDDIQFPPRRARRGERAPDMDSYGDRDRSLSQDSEQDPDHWETLLTTITPDPSLPSASSSFASNAPISNSDSNNNRSSVDRPSNSDSQQQSSYGLSPPESYRPYGVSFPLHNLPTPPPPPPAPEPPTADICDLETSPNTSDTDNAQTTSQRRPHTARTHARLINRRTRALRRQVDAFAEYYSAFNQNFDRGQHSEAEARAALEQMRIILERVSRRDDIPDEWFNSVGLSRADVMTTGSDRRRAGRRSRRSLAVNVTRNTRERL